MNDKTVWLSQTCRNWKDELIIVKPETVIKWHKSGFKLSWKWKSHIRLGRPKTDLEIRNLIRNMSQANPLWGAPRIHGELHKFGFNVSQATVMRCMVRSRGNPSQSWRTFLHYHTQHGFNRPLCCPKPRSVKLPASGKVVEIPILGGLHHRYCRRAA